MGNNRISVTAQDPSGNIGSVTIIALRVPESVPPTVVATSPVDLETAVSPTQTLLASFSEEVDPATIDTNTFTLTDTQGNLVYGDVTYEEHTATFSPFSPLAYSTSYTATITTEVKDLSGNNLVQNHVWQFTTGEAPDATPPVVSEVDPPDEETCVPLDVKLTATFSEPVAVSTLNTDTFLLSDSSSNPVAGRISNLTSSSTFIPYRNLEYTTGYRATITTGATDLSANHLASDYSWTFNTVPSSGHWEPVSNINAPTRRALHSAIWSGSDMIIWGGDDGDRTNTGGRYNPTSDTWQATSTEGAPAGRIGHSAVWTGSEMIVWGGDTYYQNYQNDGGRYDPVNDGWQDMTNIGAPSARRFHAAVWTGSEMIIWGGFSVEGYLSDGGRYNPGNDTWQSMATYPLGFDSMSNNGSAAIWTGSEMIILSGNAGARYNPSTDSWQTIPDIGSPLNFEAAVWTGTEVLVWGVNYFAAYNPLTDNWRQLPQACSPSYREDSQAVWTGSEMIIWGGQNRSYGVINNLDTGGYYSFHDEKWRATSLFGSPPPGSIHTAVWTDSEMIVWGGSSGGRFTP